MLGDYHAYPLNTPTSGLGALLRQVGGGRPGPTTLTAPPVTCPPGTVPTMSKGGPQHPPQLYCAPSHAASGLGDIPDTVWSFLSVAGAAAGAYHGYKRNHGSIGWAIGWALLGSIAPVITVPVALAQGFGKPKA